MCEQQALQQFLGSVLQSSYITLLRRLISCVSNSYDRMQGLATEWPLAYSILLKQHSYQLGVKLHLLSNMKIDTFLICRIWKHTTYIAFLGYVQIIAFFCLILMQPLHFSFLLGFTSYGFHIQNLFLLLNCGDKFRMMTGNCLTAPFPF